VTEKRFDEIETADGNARYQVPDGDPHTQRAAAKMAIPETFERAVEQLRARDPLLKKTEAMQQARLLWPDLLTEFQAESVEKARDALARADLRTRCDPAVVAFEELTDEIQERDRCSHFEASRKAARAIGSTALAKYREVVG
jgi:hypothetical protein